MWDSTNPGMYRQSSVSASVVIFCISLRMMKMSERCLASTPSHCRKYATSTDIKYTFQAGIPSLKVNLKLENEIWWRTKMMTWRYVLKMSFCLKWIESLVVSVLHIQTVWTKKRWTGQGLVFRIGSIADWAESTRLIASSDCNNC